MKLQGGISPSARAASDSLSCNMHTRPARPDSRRIRALRPADLKQRYNMKATTTSGQTRLTRDEALAELHKLADELGHDPKKSELPEFLRNQVRTIFGKWCYAQEAAGFVVPSLKVQEKRRKREEHKARVAERQAKREEAKKKHAPRKKQDN